MDVSTLFFGILPLLVFVVIDSFSGLRAGVVAAILFALGEAVYTLIVFQTIDNLTIGSTLLVLVFGVLSLKANNAIFLKLQPVVLGLILGVVLLVMQVLGTPLMVLMVEKYQYMVPEQYRAMVVNPVYLKMLARLSGVLGFGFLLHAALVAWSAFYTSKWWWIAFRGLGFYVMLMLCVAYVRFF
ncbi:MAG TPA: septation protein IspZ [Myxococcota bacterium]|nr:septation protein IspZ [Myxococcota bacterium]